MGNQEYSHFSYTVLFFQYTGTCCKSA